MPARITGPVALAVCLACGALAAAVPKVDATLDLVPVWSGHPVSFALLTHKQHQFAAFYDADRRMTVASRTLDSNTWQMTRLPTNLVWDSHNYVTMTIDDNGYLHVSGNMHVVPLIYFRSEKPLDATTLKPAAMVGLQESRCTYPQFLRGASNELIFTYRDGRSGSGDQIYNVYDLKTRTWKRLLDKPLTDGQNKMNAYFCGPKQGPDGYFHLAWVWRNHGGCESNHDLSYARSKDLMHWERSDGTPQALPIRLETAEIVDPVPVKGGIINSVVRMGFDSKKRVVLSYTKYDTRGFSQACSARLENGKWKLYQTSDWEYRWDFSGGGSIVGEINVGSVEIEKDGALSQSYSHVKYGGGVWLLDPLTLKAIGKAQRPATLPPGLGKLESTFPGMQAKWAEDLGNSGQTNIRYLLRWETLSANRDRPRQPPLPEPSMLRLYKISLPQRD